MTPVFPLEGIIAFINLVNGGKIIETHASPVEAIANTNRLLPDQAIDVPVELLVRSVTNDELACFCREQLANYKVPKATGSARTQKAICTTGLTGPRIMHRLHLHIHKQKRSIATAFGARNS